MEEVSYCAVHNTYPIPGEPCWQCANPFIEEYQAQCEKLKEALQEIVDIAGHTSELCYPFSTEEAQAVDAALSDVLECAEDALK